MKFSYSAVWDDTAAMLKRHGSLLFALAGVFYLLPGLLTGYFFPPPTDAEANWIAAMMDYYRAHWPWLLLGSLVNTIGSVAIYLMLFDRRGGTVGSAIAAALPIVPFYFLMSILVWFAIVFGAMLFVLPGIYLIGRLTPSGAVMVAEGRRSPLDALGSSWRLTKGNGWAVAGLFLVVLLAGSILSFVVTAVLGSIFILIGGREGVGGLLVLILNSALTAILYTVMIVLLAAIYRRLRPAGSDAPATASGT